MDFARIQKFVIGQGEKFVILQDGEPAMVVMSFNDYEKLSGVSGEKNIGKQSPRETTLPMPQRQDEWQMADAGETEFIAEEQHSVGTGIVARARLEEIRLEDLPL